MSNIKNINTLLFQEQHILKFIKIIDNYVFYFKIFIRYNKDNMINTPKEVNLTTLLTEQEKDLFKENLFQVASQAGFDIELKKAIKEHPKSSEWQIMILNDIYHENTQTIIKAYSTENKSTNRKKATMH